MTWFGVVEALGEGVTAFAPGDFVADMPVIGGYTQYLCVDSTQLIPAPAGLDPAAAVCMILSYTTAYQMLTRECSLQRGDSILVHAAGGAVGTAMLELGREMGLKVYGTASSGKHDLVRHFGATPIDYREEDFVQRIERETAGRGVDAVFDTIGAANWARSYRCLARGGHPGRFWRPAGHHRRGKDPDTPVGLRAPAPALATAPGWAQIHLLQHPLPAQETPGRIQGGRDHAV